MALTGEQKIADGQALVLDGVEHGLGLVGGHHLVELTLEEDHRGGKLVDVVDGRARAISIDLLRKGAHKPVEITRLELVRELEECLQVANAKMARTGAKIVAE